MYGLLQHIRPDGSVSVMPEVDWQRIAVTESAIISDLTAMVDELVTLLHLYHDTEVYEARFEDIKKRIEG